MRLIQTRRIVKYGKYERLPTPFPPPSTETIINTTLHGISIFPNYLYKVKNFSVQPSSIFTNETSGTPTFFDVDFLNCLSLVFYFNSNPIQNLLDQCSGITQIAYNGVVSPPSYPINFDDKLSMIQSAGSFNILSVTCSSNNPAPGNSLILNEVSPVSISFNVRPLPVPDSLFRDFAINPIDDFSISDFNEEVLYFNFYSKAFPFISLFYNICFDLEVYQN